MTTANTIIAQLGRSTGMLAAMLEAHSFVGGDDMVQFSFKAKATNKANKVRIVLDASDTYTVEFWYVRGATCVQRSSLEGVYADQLRPIFERATGLRVSL